jgi:hypothetical protein
MYAQTEEQWKVVVEHIRHWEKLLFDEAKNYFTVVSGAFGAAGAVVAWSSIPRSSQIIAICIFLGSAFLVSLLGIISVISKRNYLSRFYDRRDELEVESGGLLALRKAKDAGKSGKTINALVGGFFVALLVSFLLFGLAIFLGLQDQTAPSHPEKKTDKVDEAAVDLQTPVESFHFLFDLAGGWPDWSRGVDLTVGQRVELEKLLGSLKACVGSAPNQNVEIQIRGFADANEFPSNSARQNVDAANSRAKKLHDFVKAKIGDQNTSSKLILLPPIQWASEEKMSLHPRYFSAKSLRETGLDRDQGLFNRRAELVLLRAGACSK